MAVIDNPRHSRPIDVHRWSEHPEVKALVEGIWDGGYLPDEITGKLAGGKKAKTGPKPKTSFKKQLRVLILDLYVAWLEDPELSIGVSMSVNAWNTNSRYNALHLSKKLIPIIKALVDAELLDFAQGSYAGAAAKGNRTARIRASEKLQAMFREAKFVRDDVTRFEGAEIIILRDAKDAGQRGKEIEYEDTDNAVAMRKELRAYNALLTSAFIDVATLQKPVIQTAKDIEASRVHIHRDNSRTRRVFSRKNWEMNGRFYGGWWQRINDDWRSKIFIDDQPTIEVDFKGLHVAMLYAKAGEEMQGDPYDIPRKGFQAYPKEMVRAIIKQLALTAINAKDKSSAYKAFRDGSSTDFGKTRTNNDLDKFLRGFLDHNPVLEDYLFSDQGIRLMYLDSQITAHVHRHFTEKGVPVLSVHDSYIIDHMKVAELRQVMAEASEAVVGRALPTAIKLPDMPEYAHVSDEELQEHIENRKGIRCQGYVDRVLAYEARTGRVISPI
ncbi:hypothetical protein [Roseovarius dicentrarchi]|uniref:hypothetical protein n=1 Tax=Roseovarius dicentrarchi TaxID=2250573 RepID=UPI000DEBCDC4|nr:hypothetical protein [Roseovarius dicentrarchi]